MLSRPGFFDFAQFAYFVLMVTKGTYCRPICPICGQQVFLKLLIRVPRVLKVQNELQMGSFIHTALKGNMGGNCGLSTIINFTPQKHKIRKIGYFQLA